MEWLPLQGRFEQALAPMVIREIYYRLLNGWGVAISRPLICKHMRVLKKIQPHQGQTVDTVSHGSTRDRIELIEGEIL
jgi:hypothetical protein